MKQFLATCNNTIGPKLNLGYSVNPIFWGVPPTFFLGPNQQRYIPSWDNRPDNITKVVNLYAGLLFGLWELNPPFGTTNASISFQYHSAKPGNITIITLGADNMADLRVLQFNVDNPRGSTTVPGLNAIFGLADDVPLTGILVWTFATWSSLALFDFGQLADPAANIPTNIFVDETTYENYNLFLKDVVAPFFYNDTFGPGFDSFDPIPLNETNKLQANPTSLQTTYLCSQRQLKGWISIFVSVLAADAALIFTAYNLFIFVAGYVQKWRDSLGEMKHIIANFKKYRIPKEQGIQRTTSLLLQTLQTLS